MENEVKVVCIDVESLKNLIGETVSAELEKFKVRLSEQKAERKPLADKLRVKDVAELLDCSTKTITTYHQKGFLPKPKVGLNGKPYWDKQEIIDALRAHDLAWKYNL